MKWKPVGGNYIPCLIFFSFFSGRTVELS